MRNRLIFTLSIVLAAHFASCNQKIGETKVEKLAKVLENNLYNNIIPFWENHTIDEVNGGFYGIVDATGKGNPEAPKGAILNTRILWAFSAIHLKDKDKGSLKMAKRAYDYLTLNFIDTQYGGVYYTLDKSGKAIDESKNVYANSFAIYGLSEYYRATGNERALEQAISIFELIDNFAHDEIYGGYGENYKRDWLPIEPEGRHVSDKSMNTSLHVMEAFANLYRVWKSPLLEKRLEEMIVIFLDKIINPETQRQHYEFSRYWVSQSDIESYGHDIECSWLLLEAAEILGNEQLLERVRTTSIAMAEASLKALDENGRMLYETKNGEPAKSLQWWTQAEAIVGFINAWQLTRDEIWLDRAWSVWNYTEQHFVDKKYGEWYWGFNEEGVLNKELPKVTEWKAPYHNSRMCLEIIRRSQQSNPEK